ncbi:MAG: hypothetical protein A2085_11645 [Gemmatimonadetes bacterium GWC2_71_10]|nr:MAG: hypothetical protein A2085_11645 [Gemmatimonadetes bacterium GWC2_71_10]
MRVGWKVHAVMALVQAIFATLPIAAKFVLPELGPTGIVFCRIAGSAIGFGALIQLSGAPKVSKWKDLAGLAGLAVIGVVFNQLLFLEGVQRTTAINANVLITAIPVFTLAIALLLKRERATVGKVAGILIAAAGAVYLIGPDRITLDPAGTTGAAMITANTLLYAGYLVLSKDMLKRYPPLTVIAYVFGFGAVMILPFGAAELAHADITSLSAQALVALVYIVLFPSLTAYFLSVWALRRTASSQVAMWVYIQPVLTAVAAPAILGEKLTPRAVAAAAVIFAGMGLTVWAHHGRRPAVVAAPEEGF